MSVPDAEQAPPADNAKTTKVNEIERNGKIEKKDEEEPNQATTAYNHVSTPVKQAKGAEKEKDVTAWEAKIDNLDKENEQLQNAKKALDNSENIKELEGKLAKKNLAILSLEKDSKCYADLLKSIESGDYISKQQLNEKYINKDEFNKLQKELNDLQSFETDKGDDDNDNNNDQIMIDEFKSFKHLIVQKLQSIKKDSSKLESEHRGLQIRFNDERQQRGKTNKQQELKIKTFNSQIKTLRNKYNDIKNENAKNSQNTQKIEKQFQSEKESIQNRVDKLIKDKEHLNKQLDTQKALVERVRKEKKEVSENNQTYLRNEKQKISKELDREQVIKLELEIEVTRLQDVIKSQNISIKEYKSTTHTTNNELQKQSTTAKNAIREKNVANMKLQEKNKKYKVQLLAIDEKNHKMHELQAKYDNFRKENAVLHESLRKKSEKEKKFEEREQKLRKKIEKVDKKEEWVNKKIADNKSQKKHRPRKPNYKSRNRDEDTENKDPLYAIRNLLPWHWISIILFVVLMLAVASRNL